MKFEKNGYEVDVYCSELKLNGSTGFFTVKLKDDYEIAGAHPLYDDSKYTVIVVHTTATINGYVKGLADGEVVPLSGATVTAVGDHKTYSATTNSDGHFTISCDPGVKYSLKVRCNGFDDVNIGSITPSETVIEISMTEKSHTNIFGLDAVQVMMLFGILFIILVVLIAYYAVIKARKGETEMNLVKDYSEEKKD